MGAFFRQDKGKNNENPTYTQSITILLLNALLKTQLYTMFEDLPIQNPSIYDVVVADGVGDKVR